jgi:hypothetical protein
MRVLDHLLKAVRDAAAFNRDIQVPPACILWPDKERQWEGIMARLLDELPELFILGNYSLDTRTGPSIWLRCVLANRSPLAPGPLHQTPILYLSGVSRQDLRAVENCPEHLKPLADLQYRGTIWNQSNAKDWTILAFLRSPQGGLGLDVAQDNDTKQSMLLALSRLLDEEVEPLKNKRLDAEFFKKLLIGDPRRQILEWIDHPEKYRTSSSENEWLAFVEVCRSQFGIHPEKDGPLVASERLALREGSWKTVWDRFCEAPNRYPHIPAQIKKCKMPGNSMLWSMGKASEYEGWPQWNELQETALRQGLLSLAKHDAATCRTELITFEQHHFARRSLVWAELREASLAQALEHLVVVASETRKSLNAGSLDDVVQAYLNSAWKTDDAVLSALACVESSEDFNAVTVAIRSVYLPWLEDSARHLQNIWEPIAKTDTPSSDAESCIVFVDGLRVDSARRLKSILAAKGAVIDEQIRWAALPSVTGTGKPAVAPLASTSAAENPSPTDFQAMSPYQFEKALKDSGWMVIRAKDPIPAPICQGYPVASTVNKLWVEIGNIDHEGHERGAKLAKQLPALLAEVAERIEALLSAGWFRIRVVTDHGWLLLPGGLPKSDLPSAVSENKWGRCALLKSGATTAHRVFPWHWNPDESVVLADGISCFRSNEEYTHGGLSLQECLTLDLILSLDAPQGAATIAEVKWKGLRCSVLAQGTVSGLHLDVRAFAEDANSSLINKTKPVEDDGRASVLIVDMDGDLEGIDAFVVLTNDAGILITQISTRIGG